VLGGAVCITVLFTYENTGLLAGIFILLFTSHVTIAQKPFTVDVLLSTGIKRRVTTY
jgi:hypothetical protein